MRRGTGIGVAVDGAAALPSVGNSQGRFVEEVYGTKIPAKIWLHRERLVVRLLRHRLCAIGTTKLRVWYKWLLGKKRHSLREGAKEKKE